MSQIKYNYVINLKRRQDRLNEFENNKNKTVLKDEKFIRFEAFDGSDFDNEVKRFNIEDHVIFRFMKKMKLSVSPPHDHHHHPHILSPLCVCWH